MKNPEAVVFQEHPTVHLATNIFVGFRTVLMVDYDPLVEVVQLLPSQHSLRFSIYHEDGAKLGVVSGNQVHLTEDGDRAGLTLRHPSGATVCELGNKTLWELRRVGAAAVALEAELYAPGGVFVAFSQAAKSLRASQGGLHFGGVSIIGSLFQGGPNGIGVHIRTGSIPEFTRGVSLASIDPRTANKRPGGGSTENS